MVGWSTTCSMHASRRDFTGAHGETEAAWAQATGALAPYRSMSVKAEEQNKLFRRVSDRVSKTRGGGDVNPARNARHRGASKARPDLFSFVFGDIVTL